MQSDPLDQDPMVTKNQKRKKKKKRWDEGLLGLAQEGEKWAARPGPRGGAAGPGWPKTK